MPRGIQTKPVPYCPDCGAQMVLRKPRSTSRTQFIPFWGCSLYPDCRGSRNIGEDGKPEEDDDDYQGWTPGRHPDGARYP
jgi:ssDNA-binding Zn-finger/Zn-ribbon topoisomerase 1